MAGGGILSRFFMDAEFKKWAEGEILDRIEKQPRTWTELWILGMAAFFILRFAYRQFAAVIELFRESSAPAPVEEGAVQAGEGEQEASEGARAIAGSDNADKKDQ